MAAPPGPDTPAGLAILGALILGSSYLLLYIGAFLPLSGQALWIVTLNLLLAVTVSLLLVAMLGSDRARATQFELEFARTAEAHLAAGETLVESSPIGGILSGYARAASEQRQLAREHSYAASLSILSAGFSLLATLLVGLAMTGGGLIWLLQLGLFVEFFAFTLVALAAGALLLSVGRRGEEGGFDVLLLRRWRSVTRPNFAYVHSLSQLPWAIPPPTDEVDAPWRETPP